MPVHLCRPLDLVTSPFPKGVLMPAPSLRDSVDVHPDVVWREIEGEIVLLHLTTGLYYGLDEIGAAIWRHLMEAGMSLETVRDRLIAEFEGDPAAIERDLLELVARLSDARLLSIRE